MEIKIAIGIPNTGSIKAQTAFCLFRMLKGIPYEYSILFKEGSILHANRETIAKLAIEKGFTHLLFLDSDMYFEANALKQLIERDKDIIGANYYLRKLPKTTTVKMAPEKKAHLAEEAPDGLFTCDAVGTGFLLIKTDVFKKLPHPWFFWKSDEQGDVLEGEDSWFCRQAREAGFDVWCDLQVVIKHIGDYLY
ncbi:MAG: hypothetical protein Q6360_13090 [Candidatus Brocadiales bacterium]|nr:hypothetical protein [Candidatus Brocadiales bacterium]